MLFDAFNGTDGSVFNLRKLQTKTKVKTDIVNKFLFTDDCLLNATTKANMQNSVDKFLIACDNFGLTISSKKSKVMYQAAPGKPYVELNITIKGQRLTVVEKFTYLGSTFSKSVVMDDEVNARLEKASVAFGQFNRNLWNRRGISVGNQNQSIPSCRPYHPPLWLWNVGNLSTAYTEAKPLSHDLSEEDL